VRELPRYDLQISVADVRSDGGHSPVRVELSVECKLLGDNEGNIKTRKHKGRRTDWTSILTLTSDLGFIDYRRIPWVSPLIMDDREPNCISSTKSLREAKDFVVEASLTKPSQSVNVIVSSVGLFITLSLAMG
jgi:ATP-dependent DNA helicase HFM1/MER3